MQVSFEGKDGGKGGFGYPNDFDIDNFRIVLEDKGGRTEMVVELTVDIYEFFKKACAIKDIT